MAKISYKATKTRSNRPGWSVTFRHPKRKDSRGQAGLKIRRGLGTTDSNEADRLVSQLNVLLSDQSWWSIDRRKEAEQNFDVTIVSAFFDGMETGKISSHAHRDSKIPMPTQVDGYSRVMLLGTTGAGKTTLLRHFIGSDHINDRFPSTSTARTTTYDIEIITTESPFESVVTFMPEHEVRAHVEECIEDACLSAIHQYSDEKIANALLSHREQRFRLFYLLGTWQEPTIEEDDGFSFDDETEIENFNEEYSINTEEAFKNKKRLSEFVDRIKDIANKTGEFISQDVGNQFDRLDDPEEKIIWLEYFGDELFKQDDFSRLCLDIMDDIEDRFNYIKFGDFEKGSTDWPISWTYKEESRDKFLEQVRWFSSNHFKQFGRLLTPLVDGLRVRGQFFTKINDISSLPKLVFLDGEGIGHSTKSSSSISTRITRRFTEVDVILIVDNAEQPMQTAPLELIRSIGNSGHSDKIVMAFTHFDLVKGPNFKNFQQKREHIMNSVRDAIGTLKQSIGAPISAMLERQTETNSFFLGGLDRNIETIPSGFIDQLHNLFQNIQNPPTPTVLEEVTPIYSMEGLESALRDAVKGFNEPWKGRLGIKNYDEIPKEHWTRIKALTRRFANAWSNEYDTLRPAADLVSRLQENISKWLDNPASWNRTPKDDEERDASLSPIRQSVFDALHDLADARLADLHRIDWQVAFNFGGRGSSYRRAEEIERIYENSAPSISTVMSENARNFLHTLYQLVIMAVEENRGQFRQPVVQKPK